MENTIFITLLILLFVAFGVMLFMVIKFFRASEQQKAQSVELAKDIKRFTSQTTSRRTIKTIASEQRRLAKAQEEFSGHLTKDFGRQIVKAASEAVRRQKGVLGEIMLSKALEYEYGYLYRLGGDFPADAMGLRDDLIQFIEMKTDRDKLTDNEKKFQQLLNEGKVTYSVVRLGDPMSQPLKELFGDQIIEMVPRLPIAKPEKRLTVRPCKYCGREFEQSGHGFKERMNHYAYRKRNGGGCPTD